MTLLRNDPDFKLARLRFNPRRANARSVMATPPTVTVTTSLDASLTRPVPAGHDQSGSATVTSPVLSSAAFAYGKAHLPAIGGSTYPSRSYVKFTGMNNGSAQTSNGHSVRTVHHGTRVAFPFIGNGQKVMLKVDDQYATLTPYSIPSGGSVQYLDVLFGSAGRHTIELIQSSADRFMGAVIEATGSLSPAAIRGPKVMIPGDSFADGTAADGGTSTDQWQVFADAMQWDHVCPIGLGGTGLLNNATTKLTLRQQLVSNVYPFAPDMVIFCVGRNDTGSLATDVYNEMLFCIDDLKANLPKCALVIDQPGGYGTPTKMSLAFWATHRAILSAALARSIPVIGANEMPLQSGVTPHTMTLTAGASANATSLTVSSTSGAHADAVYESAADGIRIRAKALTGSTTINLDGNLITAQANGTVFTQVGDCMWSGTGNVGATTSYGSSDAFVYSDGAHMAQAGQEAAGLIKADQVMDLLF